MEAGALDGKAGLQEGVQAEKAAAEEMRARNDLADASRYGHKHLVKGTKLFKFLYVTI